MFNFETMELIGSARYLYIHSFIYSSFHSFHESIYSIQGKCTLHLLFVHFLLIDVYGFSPFYIFYFLDHILEDCCVVLGLLMEGTLFSF